MSHLQKRYTDFFYIEELKKGPFGRTKRKLKKKWYLTRKQFIELYPMQPWPSPNGVFPCQHEERDFLSNGGKKHNTTHRRMKRKNKARIKARRSS